MQIRSNDEREKGKKITLNIPTAKGETKVHSDEIYRGSSLLDKDYIELEKKFRRTLQLSSYDDSNDDSTSSSSEDEEEKREELEKKFVAKCPDRIKDEKKQDLRNHALPYSCSTRSGFLQSGGDIIISPIDDSLSFTNYAQLPAPLLDLGTKKQKESVPEDVREFYFSLSPNQRESLDKIITEAESTLEPVNLNFPKSFGTHLQQFIEPDHRSNSPDSNYGTMSPASHPPPSPHSLHSPNPLPNDKTRYSESDSLSSLDLEHVTCDSPLPKSNLIFISPQPRKTSNIISSPSSYLQVVPGYSQTQRLSRSIRPDSETIVEEMGLSDKAEYRLRRGNHIKSDRNMCTINAIAVGETKDLEFLIEKGKIRSTTADKEQIKKITDELRKNLIALILGGPKQPNFYERLFARIVTYNRSYSNILTGKDTAGYTPLLAAAILRNDHPIIARLIVELTDEVGILDGEENTVLHYVVKQGNSHAQVLGELLYSDKFNVDTKNISSKTALHMAIECYDSKPCLTCVKQLVKHGASLVVQDFDGKTALHLAVATGDLLLLKALLHSRTVPQAIDVVDNDRNTPLHIAASRNDLLFSLQKDLIVQLVLSRAQHGIRNNMGRTALMLVHPDRKEEIRAIFKRKF